MPRPIINIQSQNERKTSEEKLSFTTDRTEKRQMDRLSMDRLLRRPRSKQYMDAMKQLDAGGHVHNSKQMKEIMDVIKNEFPFVEIESILLGYVSKCYLGEPYEVHTIDMMGNIIQHYKRGESLPEGMEKARGLAIHGGYAFVEVYIDSCRAVSKSGEVSVIPY